MNNVNIFLIKVMIEYRTKILKKYKLEVSRSRLRRNRFQRGKTACIARIFSRIAKSIKFLMICSLQGLIVCRTLRRPKSEILEQDQTGIQSTFKVQACNQVYNIQKR
jgi:hypothetical protein